MAMIYDMKGNLTLLDKNGKPRARLGSSPDWSSLEHRYSQHTKVKPLEQPPKSSGYTNLMDIHLDYLSMKDLPEIDNIFVYAAEISDRIVGFGNINMEYILSNLKDYKYLLRKNYQSPNPYIKTLTQLLTINVYRYYHDESYNLPTTLNRSQIEQRYNLLKCLNQSKFTY